MVFARPDCTIALYRHAHHDIKGKRFEQVVLRFKIKDLKYMSFGHESHHPTDLHIFRSDLEPHVRTHDSNLDAQARALFDKNNLPHYNQEALEEAARTGAINLSDLTKLR